MYLAAQQIAPLTTAAVPAVIHPRTPEPTWGNVGCYSDFSDRILTHRITLTDNNPLNCCASCLASQYTYCGVETARQCFCGSSLNSPSSPNSGSSTAVKCDFPCPSHPDQKCGGVWGLDVWVSLPSVASVPDYSYHGCYTDHIIDSDITDLDYSLLAATKIGFNSATPENCCSLCYKLDPSYTWCGIEFGYECYCDSTTRNFPSASKEYECSSPCAGDKNQACGAAYRMNLYRATATTSPKRATSESSMIITTSWTDTSYPSTSTSSNLASPPLSSPTLLPPTLSSPTSEHSAGGYTTEQKIALGTGIGIGLPTLIVAILAWRYARR
ncbi:hypothetical protein F5Y14DRAFT_424137 [Nemania sp. NC0429]|nr:hypothetical protein F5Y14DRAFT_424137 [Nemania sp. NC0429]